MQPITIAHAFLPCASEWFFTNWLDLLYLFYTTAALTKLIHQVTAMLESNPYVIVYAINFSKAFDTVRHSEHIDKYSKMELPDCVYNWLVDFFRAHTHSSRLGGVESEFIAISASIIQGSVVGPASYVVTGSDFRPLTPGNLMVKFADDTYLVIPSGYLVIRGPCVEEIQHVGDWASTNNLRLNNVESMESVLMSSRCRCTMVIPPPVVATISRVEEIKALDLTISRKFSVAQHVNHRLIVCAVTVCTAHSSTSWPADRRSTYCFSGHSRC